MATSHTSVAALRPRWSLGEVVLGIFFVVLVAALWFGFFSFVPLEFSPPRIR